MLESCACGHAAEEHGRDPQYPGSTSCQVCECVAYDAVPIYAPTNDVIGPRTLSDVERRILNELSCARPLRPGYIGAGVWGGSHVFRKPQSYARAAGKILKSLEKKGYARFVVLKRGDFGWVRVCQPRRV
jgi:hypothetical protein